MTLISVTLPSRLQNQTPRLDPAAPTYHPYSLPERFSWLRDDTRSSVPSCSWFGLDEMKPKRTFVPLVCLSVRVFGPHVKGGGVWLIATSAWSGPAEWISFALKRCQEDKWPVFFFSLAKAPRPFWQNCSFCSAGCLSVIPTTLHFNEHSLLAGPPTTRDASQQQECWNFSK